MLFTLLKWKAPNLNLFFLTEQCVHETATSDVCGSTSNISVDITKPENECVQISFPDLEVEIVESD